MKISTDPLYPSMKNDNFIHLKNPFSVIADTLFLLVFIAISQLICNNRRFPIRNCIPVFFSFGIQHRLAYFIPLELDMGWVKEWVVFRICFHETIHPLFGGGPFCDFSISSIIARKTSRTAYKQRTIMFPYSIRLSLLFLNRYMIREYFRNVLGAGRFYYVFIRCIFADFFYLTLICSGLREHDISYIL